MTKKFKQMSLIVVVTAVIGLMGLVSGLVLGQEAGNGQTLTAATVGTGFSYQGVLETGGSPLDGTCDMQFTLWDADSDGAQIGSAQSLPAVVVNRGLFTVQLNSGGEFGSAAFIGDARWLEIGVWCSPSESDYTILSPRQPLTAVPYAHTLRPGATIDAQSGTALIVNATSSSSLIVNGASNSNGALRVNNNSSSGTAFTTYKTGGAGVASYARNIGSTGSGAAGYSANWFGVYGFTGASSNNYGLYSPDNLYTRNVNFAGAMMIVAQNQGKQILETGDVAAFAGISDGTASDGQPIIQVGPATVQNSTAVAGVVYGRFPRELLNAPPEGLLDDKVANYDRTESIQQGDYMLLVVYGPAQVKTDAATTGIQPGDLLAIGETNTAKLVNVNGNSAASGAVFGKALETAAADKTMLYVFVTLQ